MFDCRYLQKLSSGTVKRWQSRYFELSGHYLKYYEEKGKKDAADEENVKGTIDLENLSFCTVDGSELHLEMIDGRSAFEIKVKSLLDRVLSKDAIVSLTCTVKSKKRSECRDLERRNQCSSQSKHTSAHKQNAQKSHYNR